MIRKFAFVLALAAAAAGNAFADDITIDPTPWAALGLAIFVAVITPLFHNFWGVAPAQAILQQQMFFKNVAILAGLLLLARFGGGRWSLDAIASGYAAPRGALAASRS